MNDPRSILVSEWMTKFGQAAPSRPIMPDEHTRILRVRLIAEELCELAVAFGLHLTITGNHTVNVQAEEESLSIDLVEAADAVSDLDVVVTGTAVACGFPQQRLLEENMRSNHSKADERGNPIFNAAGKIMKGPNYEKADILSIIVGAQSGRLKPLPIPADVIATLENDKEMLETELRQALEDQARLDNDNIQLRRHHVTIMDIGECLVTLGSVSNQTGAQINVMGQGGVAIGLQRAAHRTRFGNTSDFGEEMEIMAAYWEAKKAGRMTAETLLLFISPPEKPRTMG